MISVTQLMSRGTRMHVQYNTLVQSTRAHQQYSTKDTSSVHIYSKQKVTSGAANNIRLG
jgi:hypothetical protein